MIGGNGGDQHRAAAPQDNGGFLPAPNAIVPYRPPPNEGQNDGNRNGSSQGAAQGYGNQSHGYGSNQGYGGGYNRSSYQQRPRNSWWADNWERAKDEKIDKVWRWYSETMEEKEREKRTAEEKLKEEEEKKRIQAAEEERAKAKKEREEFEKSLGKMVKENMKEVCNEVMGKKAVTSQASSSRLGQGMQHEVCRQDEAKRKEQENRWRREDAAAREQLEKSRNDELERLRIENEDLLRMPTGKASRELDSLKADNQALIHDIIVLRDEVENLKRGSKRSAEAVIEKSPPAEPVRGKSRQEEGCQTPAEWARLTEAYRRVRDEKDMAEREVSALKERINRIKIASPSSMKRRILVRRRSGKAGGSPVSKNGDHVKVTFVRKIDEGKEAFYKRVSNDLAKLRKAQLEALCADEEIDYAGVKKSAADLADIYTASAFHRPTNRRLISEQEEEEHVDEDQEEIESVDIAATSTDDHANSESS